MRKPHTVYYLLFALFLFLGSCYEKSVNKPQAFVCQECCRKDAIIAQLSDPVYQVNCILKNDSSRKITYKNLIKQKPKPHANEK